MCYGSVDPKYMLRDTRACAKGVAFAADKSEVAGAAVRGGFAARVGCFAGGVAPSARRIAATTGRILGPFRHRALTAKGQR